MNNLQFIGGSIINLESVEELENELGVVFPHEYKTLVTQHNGASVLPFAFRVGTLVESINEFHRIEKKHYFVDERLPDGVIPFARDAGDNQICFDYRKQGIISIVFWDYGSPKNDGQHISYVADSFKSFLDMLFEFDE